MLFFLKENKKICINFSGLFLVTKKVNIFSFYLLAELYYIHTFVIFFSQMSGNGAARITKNKKKLSAWKQN